MTEALAAEATVEQTGVSTEQTSTTQQTAETTKSATTETTSQSTGKTAADVIDEVKKESPWPDDWREQLAGKDEAFLRQLKRYPSPTTFARGWKEREDLIRSGKLKVDKPADGADEKALAAWRKSVGIPDKPEDYKLPDEIVKNLTDEDKPVLAQFTEFAHKKGMTNDAVAGATEWFVEAKRIADEHQSQADAEAKDKAEDALRKEWVGPEYKGNLNLAKRFVEDHLGLNYQEYAGLRLPDGRMLGNVPELMMKLADAGRNTYGDAVFANSDVLTRHESRKAEITKIRNTDFDRYVNEGLDKEMRQIIELELKRKK